MLLHEKTETGDRGLVILVDKRSVGWRERERAGQIDNVRG
jgi:hypothetical protein